MNEPTSKLKRAIRKNSQCALLLLLVVALCNGCISYRFQGSVEHYNAESVVKRKYRIAKIEHTGRPQTWGARDPWSIAGMVRDFNSDDLCRSIMNMNTEVYDHSAQATPLDVKVTIYRDTKSGFYSLAFPYMLSLGTLPFFMQTSSMCEVSIVQREDGVRGGAQRMNLRSNMKLTAFTPIALIPYSDVPNVSASKRSQGIMKAPHLSNACFNDLESVYVKTLSDAILASIQEMERNTSVE